MITMGIVSRAVLSGVAVVAYRMINFGHEVVSPLISGPAAAGQLANSDMGWVNVQVASKLFNGSGLGFSVLLVVLACIWAGPIINMFRNSEKA